MLQFAALAIFLGIKHSFDADHLLAVSNILPGAKSLPHAATMSLSWAAGHMLTAIAATLLLISFSQTLLPLLLDKLELLVALMLIFLGALGLLQSGLLHRHTHSHSGKEHSHWHLHLSSPAHAHRHMFGIGLVHGLASNDELLLLLTASLGLSTAFEMAGGVILFSLGVVLGMLAFSALFILPLLRAHSTRLPMLINAIVGIVSIGYGTKMLVGI